MDASLLLVTFPVEPDQRRTIREELPDEVRCRYIDDVDPEDRPEAVAEADALFSYVPQRELSDEAFDRLRGDQVMQALSAGVDHLPIDRLPDGLALHSNAGAYAEPMAEHVLALYLALSKRLLIEHRKLESGEFDQFEPNRRVDGSTCGIFGFGATGRAAARLMRPLGVSVLAINRSGRTDEPVEFVGTPAELESVLPRCDGLVLTAPLTSETRGIFDREKLQLLPEDAMLINVARGELIVQRDLYEHLRANPEFQAGIEAWWTEPVRHGEFDLEYPLLDLPNVLGSPHNSAQVPGIHEEGVRQAIKNVGMALTDGAPQNRVDRARGY